MAKYQRLKQRDKAKQLLHSLREEPVRCPLCDSGIAPVELPAHIAVRCKGSPEPRKVSRWITAEGAEKLGVARKSLAAWEALSLVRMRQERYLLRDVVLLQAQQEITHRLRSGCLTAFAQTDSPADGSFPGGGA